ncbi:MAG: FAD-dependent oxidoreductase [Calditrichaeota bacterium]|nr:FAD-dependent oxidoreductase [Calditrichota bacterium]
MGFGSDKIIVIGGNDAGLSAAGRAKRLRSDLEIIVIERTPFVGYASCGFPYFISGQVTRKSVSGPGIEEIENKRGFQVWTNHEAVRIDLLKRHVTVKSLLQGEEKQVRFSKLLLATGARPLIPQAARINADNIFTLRNFADAERLDNYIKTNSSKKALVLGAGFLGLEMAEALQQRGLQVVVIDKAPQLFPNYAGKIAAIIKESVQSSDVELILDEKVTQFDLENNRVRNAHFVKNGVLETDIVLIAAGIGPNVELAKSARIPLGQSGAILVNNRQETRRMNIYAIGDCAESQHLVTKKSVWLPFAGIASKQGRVAGTNIAGKRTLFPGALGTAMAKTFGLEYGHTGLSLSQAREAGFKAIETVITSHSKSEYLIDSTEITVALISDLMTKKLLGAQVVGKADAGQRLNILATAITGHISLHELEYLDFGYTPMISNIWDPIAIAGNAAQKNIKEK